MSTTLRSAGTQLSLAENGAIPRIWNDDTGLDLRPSARGGWPFVMVLRDREGAGLLNVRIDEAYAGPCGISAEGDDTVVSFTDLHTREGHTTNVCVTIRIRPYADAFGFDVTVHTPTGRYEIVELNLFAGDVLNFGAPASEKVAIPDWGDGKLLTDPRTNPCEGYLKADRRYLSYTAEYGQDMAYGWLAAWGDNGGLGVAYLNERMITMEFKFARSAEGLEISPTFFRLRTYAEDYPFAETDPLHLGEFLLIPLEGDWHQAADVYREHVRANLHPQLPALGEGSARAATLDVNLHYPIYGAHGLTFEPVYNMSFADVVTKVKTFIDRFGVDPTRVMVWLYGTGEYGHDRNNPTQRPVHKHAGGEEGYRKMTAALKATGVGSIMQYAHGFATQQSQPDYDPEADTGKGWKMMGAVYHTVLCLDDHRTQTLYRDKVFGPFKDEGVTDMFLDQSTICKAICQRPHHDHGTDFVGILGAHARGTKRLMDQVHEIFGAQTVINIESHNDLGNVDCEMSTNGDWIGGDPNGWLGDVGDVKALPDINQYTYPHVLRMKNHIHPASMPAMLIRGHSCHVSHIADEHEEKVRYYLRWRQELLGNGPGYPYGFRDDLGLSFDRSAIEAKVFVKPGEGVTVTCRALKPDVKTEIAVDLAALGFAGAWTVPVALAADGDTAWAAWKA